jgi:RNA polymerase-binding transcription factor DksA
MPKDTTETRARLESRLKVLQGRLAEINETLREPEDDDLEEQAVDLDDDQVLERLSRAGRDEAVLVRAALKRIEDGTYGRCLSCGKAIAEARLRALPEASTCLRCARRSGE